MQLQEAQQAEDGSVQETLTPQTEQAAGMICEVKPDETANVRKVHHSSFLEPPVQLRFDWTAFC